MEFEPYHVHTCYSNCLTQPDSTMFISDYAKTYRERGHHVLCMSEHGNRSNVWEQYDICETYKNDKDNPYNMTPLAAAECYFVPDRKALIKDKPDGRNFHLILVAKNMEGFYQLNEILSEANLSGYYYHARVDFDLLGRLNYKNFICTTACVAGICKDENYEKLACGLGEIFRDNFYLEVQHHPQKIQQETNMKILRLYQKYRWPLIYGTDSHYINKEDKILREELLKSAHITYGDEDSFDLHLPTAEEAFTLLNNQGVLTKARIEEAMENTLVLREFEGVKFTNEKKIPNIYRNLTQEERNNLYRKTVWEEYAKKAGKPTEEERKEIEDEIETVTSTNTSDYFLMNKKIIEKGKEYGGVLTTTGRGSAASFVCNYAFGFTSINRLKAPVKMLPERFVSADRLINGLPDIDANMYGTDAFDKAGKEILGEFGCLPMIAFGTTKTLSAFKMLARARDLDFETSNEISKQISAYEMDVKHAKENNADDSEYDVDEDVRIDSYVNEQYLPLINESKKYKGIITSLSPHPCARLLLDRDIRREIGVVRVKSKSGSKEAVYAAFIDGRTADSLNYVKMDFLKVDVVGIISETFKAAGIPVMNVDELLNAVKGNKAVWDLYWNGITMGLNQVEREKSTQKCMKYKPKNVEELSAFVAGIRPGFRSMIDIFLARQRFSYNIPSLDRLLQTKAIPDSFLEYDEQILVILKAAGIPGPKAYAITKAIKKKKTEKVLAAKEEFKTGFTKYLKETENASDEKAKEVVEEVWKIINDAANYMFCCAHAFSMACDSLYVAWLKVNYPYELYTTMLKLYDEKKNTEKISSIIAEMKRYKNINLLSGRWGQNNTDWSADMERSTISQSLSSVKYMSKAVAEDLYKLSQKEEAYIGSEFRTDTFTPEAKKELAKLKKQLKPLQEKAEAYLANGGDEFDEEFLALYDEGYPIEQKIKSIEQNEYSYAFRGGETKHYAKMDCFTNVLRAIQMNTCLDTRQIEILIGLNYFEQFGKTEKLMKIFNEFFNGEKKLTKTIKSFEDRLELCRQFESSLENSELPAGLRLRYEMDNIGLCLYTNPVAPSNQYFVTSIDDKYTTKLNLYSIRRGTTGIVKVAKKDYRAVAEGSCITIEKFQKKPKYSYTKGQRTIVPGETDIWVTDYNVMKRGEGA